MWWEISYLIRLFSFQRVGCRNRYEFAGHGLDGWDAAHSLHDGCCFIDDFHIDWLSERDGWYLISSYLFVYNARTKFSIQVWSASCEVVWVSWTTSWGVSSQDSPSQPATWSTSRRHPSWYVCVSLPLLLFWSLFNLQTCLMYTRLLHITVILVGENTITWLYFHSFGAGIGRGLSPFWVCFCGNYIYLGLCSYGKWGANPGSLLSKA